MSVSWEAPRGGIRVPVIPVPVLEALARDWEGRAAEMTRRSRAPDSPAAWGASAEMLRAAANQLRDAIAVHGAVP